MRGIRSTDGPRARAVHRSLGLGVERLEPRDMCTLPAPAVVLRHDTGRSSNDAITVDGEVVVTALPGATVGYSTTPGIWTTAPAVPHEGLNVIKVRQSLPGLGWSPACRFVFTLDRAAPPAPALSATHDVATNGVTHVLASTSTLLVRLAPRTTAFITAVDGTDVRIPLVGTGRASIAVGAVAPGPGSHVITVTAFDVAGNGASSRLSFVWSTFDAARALASVSASATIPPVPPPPLVPKSNPFVVNVREYGAVGDNVTDDAPAIRSAWRAATLTGQPLYVPAGTYAVGKDQLLLSLADCRFTGVTVYGDGVGRSIINCMNVASSPQMLVTCPTSPGDSVYLSMKGIGIFTKTPGVGVQFGAETFADPINEPEIDLMVLNLDRSTAAVAVEINFVLNGDIRLVANSAGPGTSLLLRQASFNHFTGSYGGVGGVAVRLADSFNTGNVFTALDMENVATCVVSESPYSLGNTFIGGTWNYTTNGVSSTSGRRLVVLNPQLNPSPPGRAGRFVGAAVGVWLWPSPPIA